MAFVGRRLFGLLGFVGVGVVLPSLPACSGDDKSGLMLAISTDMLAPKDVNAVGITVSTDGKIKFNVVGRVTPEGEVLLPATLAIAAPDDPNATVGIRVVAFQETKARVMRDVTTSIPKGGRIALLRIPLNFANDGSVTGTLPDGVLPAATATSTKSLGSGTLVPRDFGASTGYDPTGFSPNCPVAKQTWVAGQCVDSYVAWSSLPTFTPASVGRADDATTCFDVYGCFAGSTEIPESGDTGVVLDRPSCSLVLHGADPAQVNVALVTAQTGACLTSGRCYVPLDHGAAGWTESADRIQLPAYVCKLTPTTASLVLAPVSKACGAKTESRTACAATASDGGTTDAGVGPLVSAEDFASSITVEPGTKLLDSAGSARVARIDLGTRIATTFATIPAGKKPWKFGSITAGALLTDGTSTGYAIAAGGQPTTVALPSNGHDAAEMTTGRLWSTGASGTVLAYSAATDATASMVAGTRIIDPSALVDMGNGRFVVGTTEGNVTACTLGAGPALNCFASDAMLSAASIVDGLAADPTSNGLGTWALTRDGLYYLTSNGTTTLSAQVIAGTSTGPVDGGFYLRYAVATVGPCAIFTSGLGLQWIGHEAGPTQHGGVLVVHQPSTPELLGVAVDATSIYYTVYAAASEGGGVFRADIPAACLTH